MLEVFQNEEFGTVRAIEEGDKVLFCATDIAKALGYNARNDDELAQTVADKINGMIHEDDSVFK